MRRETRRLGVTGTVHRTKLLKILPRAGRGSTDGEAQRRDRQERLANPHFALPSLSRRSSPPSIPSYSSRLPRTTLSLRHVFQTSVDASPAILITPQRTSISGRSIPVARRDHIFSGRGPRVLRVHRRPHAVVVAPDATLSPRACRGMLLDSYGGCRPPPRRVSPPYVLSDFSTSNAPTNLIPARPALHTHSLPMASSVLPPITSSLSPPT